jgi:glycosyltransferase involved in cell wall biosynthesis
MTVADASSSKAPLSVIIPCFNEEAMIAECLESVQFADEILVVDSFSTDKTVEIARRHATRVVQHEFWSHGAQNNWAVPQAKHPWVLVVDADERVTPELAQEIRTILRGPSRHGYEIRRRNFFLGREIRHGTWGSDYVLRLYHRDRGRYQERHVHSRVELDGRPGRCRGTMLHDTYRSLDDYARKIHRFSRGGALNEHERGKRGSAWKIFAHGVSRFFKTYLLKLGFLDGAEGLIIAFMEADYAALKYAKLWELQNKTPAPSTPGPGAAAGPA